MTIHLPGRRAKHRRGNPNYWYRTALAKVASASWQTVKN